MSLKFGRGPLDSSFAKGLVFVLVNYQHQNMVHNVTDFVHLKEIRGTPLLNAQITYGFQLNNNYKCTLYL